MKQMATALALLLVCAAVLAQEKPENSTPTQEEIKKLVAALGSDSWQERTEAEKKLIRTGKAAGPALEEALKSEDPETVSRAERILEEILYLPEETQAEVDKLFDKLKSRDDKERKEAFDKLVGMGRRVVKYIGRLLKAPSDKRIKISLTPERTHTRDRKPIKYTVKLDNDGKKPTWVPGPGMLEKGSYEIFGKSGEAQIQWSRGRSASGAGFGFVYLPPGKSVEYEREFRPYSGYSGRHILKVNFARTKGVTYTDGNGEENFLPVEHYFTDKDIAAEILRPPPVVEGGKGKEFLKLLAGIDVEQVLVKEGDAVSLKFRITDQRKNGERRTLASLNIHSWYVLLPVEKDTQIAAEGLLLKDIEKPPDGIWRMKAGQELEFDVKIQPGVEPGEYHLVCGYTELRATGQDVFRGEVVSNAVKLTVNPAEPDKEQDK